MCHRVDHGATLTVPVDPLLGAASARLERSCGITHRLVDMSDLAVIAEMARPGDSIRARRTDLGWTQAELAERSGVSQADISRIENGQLDARWSTIHRLSEALEAPGGSKRRSLASGHRRNPPATGRSKRWTLKGATKPIS